jgi:hypothetical protein
MKLLMENWKKFLKEVDEPLGNLQIDSQPEGHLGSLKYTKGDNKLEISIPAGDAAAAAGEKGYSGENLMITFNGQIVPLDLVTDEVAEKSDVYGSTLEMTNDLEKAFTELSPNGRKMLIGRWLKPFLEAADQRDDDSLPPELKNALLDLWQEVGHGLPELKVAQTKPADQRPPRADDETAGPTEEEV